MAHRLLYHSSAHRVMGAIMNLKLEELRRRLLEPVAGTPTPGQSTSVYKRSPDLAIVTHKLNEAVTDVTEPKRAAPKIEPTGNSLYQPPVAPKITDGKVSAAASPTS